MDAAVHVLGAMSTKGDDGACWETLCLSHIDDHWWGVLIEVILFIYAFFGLAIVCDDYLVPALETLCVRWAIREDVAGASFMALGSAAPEIIVNVVSTIRTHSTSDKDATNLGVSAIVGSGVIAFSLIPGACAVFCSDTLELKRRPLLRDWTAYSIALALLCVFMGDGIISMIEGLVLVVVYICYLLVVFFGASVRRVYREKFLKKLAPRRSNFVLEREASLREQSLLANAAEVGDGATYGSDQGLDDIAEENNGEDDENRHPVFQAVTKVASFISAPLNFLFGWTVPVCERDGQYERLYPLSCVLAFLWVAVFSVIISAVVARLCDKTSIPNTFVGFAVVAIGAEIPDTIQSVTVALKGYGSMAVGNAFGSQIINICIGLGLPWFLVGLTGGSTPVTGHKFIQTSAFFQVGNLLINFTLLSGAMIVFKQKKVMLTRAKGAALLVTWLLIQILYGVYVFVIE